MGIIKKLLGRELVGWSDSSSTEVYPITHVGAVYDSNGKTLEEVIDDIQQQIINGTGGGGSSASVYPINYLWAYKASESTPALDMTEEALCPTGWSQTPVTPGENQDLYMTTARKQGSTYLKWSGSSVWSSPVRISGGGGTSDTGADGDGYNYIYCLTTTENRPNLPSTITVDAIEQYEGTLYGISTGGSRSSDRINVWRDHPHGVASDAGFEWIAVAKSDNGTWGSYSTPVLWSKYGFDGKDGDTIEYIYRLTDSTTVPTTSGLYTKEGITYSVSSPTYQADDFVPDNWFDNPQSLTVSNPVQWVSVRKRTNEVWGEFSEPVKWSENSVTETIIDAPYTITNDNPWICVACDYNGNPVITSGSYGTAIIKALKGTTNKTNDFNWTASASGITPGSSSSSSEFSVSPRNMTAEESAVITITGTHKEDSSIVLSTKVTVAKIKASQPGTIPTIYELSLSKPFAIKGDSTITTSILIDVNKTDGNGRSTLTSISAINSEELHLYVNSVDSNHEITGDNILSANELNTWFSGVQVGGSIEIILRDNNNKTWDYGYITLIATGGTNIINNYNSDDFVFALVTNNHTVSLTDVNNNVGTFDPNEVVYEIVGSWDKDNTELQGISMHGLFPPTNTLTDADSYLVITPAGNCRAYITNEASDRVYLHIVPISTTKGGSVTINCFRDLSHNDFWGTLVASYNLEISEYKITLNNEGLGLNGLSRTVSDIGETLENHESLLTHTSKQLTSTIESQYVFPNLFGFSNGLTFDNSEPFIQAYGAEIVPGSIPSKITGFNVDTTQKIVVSMDTYRGGSGTYTCTAKFNNATPTELTINGERIGETNGFTLTCGSQQHVVMYFESLSSEVEGLLFEISAGNNNRMMLFNLKVEYGYTPTKFCISDEDAAVNNNTNLVPTIGEGQSTDASMYVKTQADNTGNSFTGSLSEDNVITIANASFTGTEYIVEAKNFSTIPTAGKLYTLAFTAKTAEGTANIRSVVSTNGGQLGNYTYGDYESRILNQSEGLTIHALTSEWKRYYARFYVSQTASLNTMFKPAIAIAGVSATDSLDFTNKQGGSRTFYIKDIVLQEGYTPSEDQTISDNAHTKSLINQTSSEITLQVENKMRKSGITLTADGVTINATKVAFTGADGIDYIRLGEDEDGVPYFIFCDAEGNEKWHFGLNGPQEVSAITRAQGWTALLVKAINDADFNNTKEVFTAAEIYPILINSTISGYDYAENVTYQRYVSAITNGVWDTALKPYDGLYYRSTSVDSNGVPVNPEQYIASSNDMWWMILRSRIYTRSENVIEVYGDFAIITNGKYYSIGTLGVRKNGSNYMFYNDENSIMNYLSYDNSNNVNESGELDLGRTQEALDKIGYYDNH